MQQTRAGNKFKLSLIALVKLHHYRNVFDFPLLLKFIDHYRPFTPLIHRKISSNSLQNLP
jgi:hypothetical protein